MWATFKAVCFKEAVLMSRDRRVLPVQIVLQLADVCALGWIDVRVHDMPLVVVDRDHSSASRELIERLGATGTFAVKYATSSVEQARSHIRAGRAKAAVVIPADYGRQRSAGSGATFLAIVDGSDSVSSAQATASLNGLAVEIGAQSSSEVVGQVEAHTSLMFNPTGSEALFMLPGLLALMLSNVFVGRSLRLAAERENGNLERLLMTPMSHVGLLLGLLVPHVLLVFANGLLYLAVMHFGFSVPVRGSPFWLIVALFFYSLTFLSLGALFAARAKTPGQAWMSVNIFTLPSTLLSGLVFPLSSVPKVLLPVSYAMPETHFIEIMRGLCLRGSTPLDLAPHFLFLFLAPILFLGLAASRFSRSTME